MNELADLIALHAIPLLLAMATGLLVVGAVVWHFVERFGPVLWQLVLTAWNALRDSELATWVRAVPGLSRVLTHSLTVGRYLGLYALASFAAAFAALAVFFEVADEIGVDEELAQFDGALSAALGQHLSSRELQIAALVTHLGDRNFLVGLGVIVTLALLILRHRLLAVAWASATGAGALLNVALKSLFARARPVHEHGVVVADGWSFPSGHAAGSMLVYGLLAYLVVRFSPRIWHLPTAILTALLVVFVGFSRVLLQVHYLSDVLAGYLSAAAWGLLCIAGLEAVRGRSSHAAARSPDRLADDR